MEETIAWTNARAIVDRYVINTVKEFAGIDWSAAARTRVPNQWRRLTCLCGASKETELMWLCQRSYPSVREFASGCPAASRDECVIPTDAVKARGRDRAGIPIRVIHQFGPVDA
jgi:hypothetical protein